MVAVEMLFFFPSLKNQIELAVHNTRFQDPQPLIRLVSAFVPRDVLFTPSGLTTVYWVTIAAGCLALVGLFTRPALFVYGLGYAFFVSHAYSYADVHHREALYALFILALVFSRSGEALSVDAWLARRRVRRMGLRVAGYPEVDTAIWPLKYLHVLLAMTYFSTGITKLLSGGLRWMNGYTLQKYIFITAVNRDLPIGLWLAHQHTLCILLAIGTILFELFYFVSLLVPRTAPLFFLSGVLFHLGLYVTAGHPFFEHMLLNTTLLLFLNRGWLPAVVRRLGPLARHAGPLASRAAS